MHVLTLAVAVASFGVSLAIFPRLPDGRWVTPIGALGPSLVALGPDGFDLAHYRTILPLAWIAGLVATLARQRRINVPERMRQALLLPVCAALFASLSLTFARPSFTASGPAVQLSIVGACTLMLAVGEALIRGVANGLRHHAGVLQSVAHEFRAMFLLHVVFASTAGLVVLSFPSLGAAAFAVLLGPLYATYRGFARFTDARRTYAQTIRALGRLTERAGYAADGHHQRTADLCVKVAHELGLWGESVRMLELVALFHQVGAVSVPDPDDLPLVSPAALAAAGARVLEETGYLAKQAPLLEQAARPAWEEAPLEARILRVMSTYVGLAAHRSSGEAIDILRARAIFGDLPVFEALQRILGAESAGRVAT